MKSKISKKYKRGYASYVALFKAEKKIGNIKNGIRQLTYNQYYKYRNNSKKETAQKANKEILFGDSTEDARMARQAILTPVQKETFLDKYQETISSHLKPGEGLLIDDSYFGYNIDEDEGLNYHRTLSGVLHDRHQIHFLISLRILEGEDRKKVLADYGY